MAEKRGRGGGTGYPKRSAKWGCVTVCAPRPKAKRRPRPAIDWAGRIAASGVLAQWEGETGTGDAAPSTARSLLNCDGHAFLTWAVTNLETDRD